MSDYFRATEAEADAQEQKALVAVVAANGSPRTKQAKAVRESLLYATGYSDAVRHMAERR